MTTPPKPSSALPSALATATYAVTLLEDNPLFNSGHGAVFTRDGINELEASVMVSRGFAKRGVGVTRLRRVRNPILLARAILEHGDGDLGGQSAGHPSAANSELDVPSAQGHTLLCGDSAEILAERYGLALVEPEYFFTQKRWDEHLRALEREHSVDAAGATWSPEEYLPQGTVGAVALDEDGVVCAATSTGGMTNKLTGRIGDTPAVGAGFWAEEWTEEGSGSSGNAVVGLRDKMQASLYGQRPVIALSESLKGLIADCLPTPFLYVPVVNRDSRSGLITTRSIALSGTGNGDSFMRIAAVRTVAAIARFAGTTSAEALQRVAGRSGELQKSAGDRWGKTGEGEGGIIGMECVIVRDAEGNIVETSGEILQDLNCGGMFRAWVDDAGRARVRVFREDQTLLEAYSGEGKGEDVRHWCPEKMELELELD